MVVVAVAAVFAVVAACDAAYQLATWLTSWPNACSVGAESVEEPFEDAAVDDLDVEGVTFVDAFVAAVVVVIYVVVAVGRGDEGDEGAGVVGVAGVERVG